LVDGWRRRERSIAQRFPRGPSIVFRYPSNWRVTTRRLDDVLDPHTVFAESTYELNRGLRDDCDGTHARGRASDGVFALVKEVLDEASLRRSLPRLPARPHLFRLPTSGRAGCLAPPSVAYQCRAESVWEDPYLALRVARRGMGRALPDAVDGGDLFGCAAMLSYVP
jgi:hypothetical protein